MRYWFAALLGFLAAGPLHAQQTPPRLPLDSGTVVRLQWNDGSEKGRLLAAFRPESPIVQYCRYPSPVCGASTHNPPRTRSTTDLMDVQIRRGSRAGRGALVGAGVGSIGGLLIIAGQALQEAPGLSRREQVLAVLFFAGVGSAVGAFVGSASDNWVAAP